MYFRPVVNSHFNKNIVLFRMLGPARNSSSAFSVLIRNSYIPKWQFKFSPSVWIGWQSKWLLLEFVEQPFFGVLNVCYFSDFLLNCGSVCYTIFDTGRQNKSTYVPKIGVSAMYITNQNQFASSILNFLFLSELTTSCHKYKFHFKYIL